MDQQLEEMNNKLNSVTDPTGFLRMVRRNNLFNRCGGLHLPGTAAGQGALSTDKTFWLMPLSAAWAPGPCCAFAQASVTLPMLTRASMSQRTSESSEKTATGLM